MKNFARIGISAVLGLVALALAAGATLAFTQPAEDGGAFEAQGLVLVQDDGETEADDQADDDAADESDDVTGEAIESERPFGPRGFGRHGGSHGRFHGPLSDYVERDAIHAAIAEVLGITIEEFEAARDEGTRLTDLVEELGADPEAIEAAVQELHIEALEAAVADGAITQEEADELLAKMELRSVMRDIWGPEAQRAALAEALGITLEELEAANEDGLHIWDLVEERELDVATVQQAVEAARAAAIEAAVDQGLITQEQADEWGTRPGGPGFGGPGHHGRGGGPGCGFGPGPGSGFGPAEDISPPAVDEEVSL
jgi:hypothetical protein